MRIKRLLAECYLRGLERAHVEIASWLDENTQYPEHWTKAGETQAAEVRAPAELHLLRVMCRDWRMTLEQAWETPCAMARALADVSSEADGDDTLVSEREAAAIEEAKRA